MRERERERERRPPQDSFLLLFFLSLCLSPFMYLFLSAFFSFSLSLCISKYFFWQKPVGFCMSPWAGKIYYGFPNNQLKLFDVKTFFTAINVIALLTNTAAKPYTLYGSAPNPTPKSSSRLLCLYYNKKKHFFVISNSFFLPKN